METKNLFLPAMQNKLTVKAFSCPIGHFISQLLSYLWSDLPPILVDDG